jgi:hypothetical protein
LVRLECEDRLCEGDVRLIGDAITQRLTGTTAPGAVPPRYELTVEERATNLTPEEVAVPLGELKGSDHRRPHLGVLGNRYEEGYRALFVARSRKPDKVMGKILSAVVDAAQQLGGTMPGVVCVHTSESMSWRRVSEAGVLDRNVNAIAQRNDLSKVSAIVFTSEDATEGALVYPIRDAARPLPRGFRCFARGG